MLSYCVEFEQCHQNVTLIGDSNSSRSESTIELVKHTSLFKYVPCVVDTFTWFIYPKNSIFTGFSYIDNLLIMTES